ncbi:MAG: DUF3306 domain-containing protein [Paracoccaceae bacterium]
MSRDREDEGVFARWSRLKRAPAAPEPAPQPEPSAPVAPVAEIAAEPASPEDEAALLEQLGLPAPETLAPGDDFSRFMAAHVPAFLRRRALRVLWRTNPDLVVLDGLLEYGEDYRAAAAAAAGEVVATAYKVGRGFRKAEEDEAPAAPDVATDDSAPPPAEDGPAPTPPDAEATAEPEPPEPGPSQPDAAAPSDAAPAPAPRPAPTAEADAPALPPPRRMVFIADS